MGWEMSSQLSYFGAVQSGECRLEMVIGNRSLLAQLLTGRKGNELYDNFLHPPCPHFCSF